MDSRHIPRSTISTSLKLVLDHRPANDIAGTKQIEILVDLLKTNGLHRVADLALLHEINDLVQVVVIAPERAVIGVFAATSGNRGMLILSPTSPTASRSFLMPRYGVRPASVIGASSSAFSL